MPTILFVCTGNTCRSPMAESLLKAMLQKRGINWQVKSAGINAYSGRGASEKVKKVLREEGISLKGHTTTPLSSKLLKEADIILTMTLNHKNYLVQRKNLKNEKVFTLKEFIDREDKNISDPFGRSLEAYQKLKQELQQDLKILIRELNSYFKKEGLGDKSENIFNKGCGKMKVIIGSDHAGYELKEHIKDFLKKENIEFKDVGPDSTASVDYPDFAQRAGKGVAAGEYDRGILICGTGIGMSIAANKMEGIRAALCHNVYSARVTRQHNKSNILTMGGRVVGKDLAQEIVKTWLQAQFVGEEQPRHQRRIDKITSPESSGASD